METDVLDFITNMCINTIETKKLTKKINNPIVLGQLFEFRDDFDKSIEILEDVTKNKINYSEKESLKKFFGKNIGKTLINMCLHHSDYSINIRKLLNSNQDPSEKWIQNLWRVTRNLLGVTSSIEDMDDLVVDIS